MKLVSFFLSCRRRVGHYRLLSLDAIAFSPFVRASASILFLHSSCRGEALRVVSHLISEVSFIFSPRSVPKACWTSLVVFSDAVVCVSSFSSFLLVLFFPVPFPLHQQQQQRRMREISGPHITAMLSLICSLDLPPSGRDFLRLPSSPCLGGVRVAGRLHE